MIVLSFRKKLWTAILKVFEAGKEINIFSVAYRIVTSCRKKI